MGKSRRFKIGQRVGYFTVLSYEGPDKHRHSKWRVRCKCGTEKTVKQPELVKGDTVSCGCVKRERARRMGKANLRHGESWPKKTPEYEAWQSMIGRCHNPKHRNYQYWGGRGIKVCDQWRESFENFLADVGRRPKSKFGNTYSLDRIDNDGDYEPGNVRWTTWTVQAQNRRARLPVQLRVYMSDRDLGLVKAQANKEGITLSALVRQLLFSKKLIRRPVEEKKDA